MREGDLMDLINGVGHVLAHQLHRFAALAGWSRDDCYQEAALFILERQGTGIPMTRAYLIVAAARALRRGIRRAAILVCVPEVHPVGVYPDVAEEVAARQWIR